METVERTGNVFSCKENSQGAYCFLKTWGLSCGKGMRIVLYDPNGEVNQCMKATGQKIDLELFLVQN